MNVLFDKNLFFVETCNFHQVELAYQSVSVAGVSKLRVSYVFTAQMNLSLLTTNVRYWYQSLFCNRKVRIVQRFPATINKNYENSIQYNR